MGVVIHEVVLRGLHEHLTTQQRRARSNELADLRIDYAGDRVGIDMQHDKALLVELTIIHSAKKFDYRTRAQSASDLRQTKLLGKSRAKRHEPLLVVQLRDDFFGIGQCSRNGFYRHGALANLIFRRQIPRRSPSRVVAQRGARNKRHSCV